MNCSTLSLKVSWPPSCVTVKSPMCTPLWVNAVCPEKATKYGVTSLFVGQVRSMWSPLRIGPLASLNDPSIFTSAPWPYIPLASLLPWTVRLATWSLISRPALGTEGAAGGWVTPFCVATVVSVESVVDATARSGDELSIEVGTVESTTSAWTRWPLHRVKVTIKAPNHRSSNLAVLRLWCFKVPFPPSIIFNCQNTLCAYLQARV